MNTYESIEDTDYPHEMVMNDTRFDNTPLKIALEKLQMATHCEQSECGFAIHNGVIVVWDEDHDERVLTLIDDLSEEHRSKMLAIEEHEGSVHILWKNEIPHKFNNIYAGFDIEDGDWWSIYKQEVIYFNSNNQSKSYSKKLKDPRWQRKRLKVFERDGWACRKCYATHKTLHVHHKKYRSNAEPWDYPDSELVTYCEDCHKGEHGA